jgi:hypothetical protein
VDSRLLFLSKLDDLQSRLQDPGDEYNMLSAAGLLRQLLMDSRPSRPLMDVVNRVHRIKIKFRVTKHPARMGFVIDDQGVAHVMPSGTMWYILDGIDPERFPEYPVEELDRRYFLRVATMKVKGGEVTVKDIIRHAAHSEGGVHLGKPESARMQAATGLLRVEFDGRERSAAATALKGIASVVLASMRPLREAVETELEQERKASPE